MNFTRLVVLLTFFSESQHDLKGNFDNSRPYRYLSIAGYFASILQVFVPFLFFVSNLFRPKLILQATIYSKTLLTFRPYNKSVKSSQYFYRFIDFNIPDVLHLYVQTNFPYSYINVENSKYLRPLPFNLYILLLRYFLIYIPLTFLASKNRFVSCDPSSIRNLYLYYSSISFFDHFDYPPSVFSTFEGHAWEYSILLAYSKSFRGLTPKSYVCYQHAPLTFKKASHLTNNSMFRYSSFRTVLPSGTSVLHLFDKFNLFDGNYLPTGYLITKQTSLIKSMDTNQLSRSKRILCVPEATDFELELFCHLALSLHSSTLIFSIRVQNIYFKQASQFIRKRYPSLLSLLVSSDHMSLLDHSLQSDVCVVRGSSAAIECVQYGLIPVHLADSKAYDNNVFWPMEELIGSVYPDSLNSDFLDAFEFSFSNSRSINKFAHSYYERYVVD